MRLYQQFVNEPDDRFPFSHGSQLTDLGASGLACVWFSGSLEGHGDVVGRLSRLHPGTDPLLGPQWQAGETIAAHPGRAVGNPVLHLGGDGTWHLFYVAFPPRQARETQLLHRRSRDAGWTWSEPVELAPAGFPPRPGLWPRHPLLVHEGAWLLPLCEIDRRPPRSLLWRSSDEGASWRELALPKTDSLIQPVLIGTPGHGLQVYLRDMRCRAIYRMVSNDGGTSWSRPRALDLPNNNSGIAVVPLASGRLALAFTDQQRRDRRSPIVVALSEDGGETWPLRRTLVPFLDVAAARVQYSYPSMVQRADGRLHLTLTWRAERVAHFVFDEDWIRQGEPRLASVWPATAEAPLAALRRLDLGETVYLADKTVQLVEAPETLRGALALCPLNDELRREGTGPEAEIAFELHRPARLVLAVDAELRRLPKWMARMSPLAGELRTDRARFRLLTTALQPGRHRLGANAAPPAGGGHAMYFAYLLEEPS